MNHFEILVEDSSGKVALEALLPKIIPSGVTFRTIAYRGIGRIPKGMMPTSDPEKRILLDQLPRLIRGYGNAFQSDPPNYKRAIIVVCDLDDKSLKNFKDEIEDSIKNINPKPHTILCFFSIEEGEAWLLGDPEAVIEAYPKADKSYLYSYIPDSICGTWEKLADLIYPGGARALKLKGFTEVGQQKHQWAKNIAPKVDPNRTRSNSFKYLMKKISEVTLPVY